MKRLLTRLFFTADDASQGELDIGWLLLAIAFINGVVFFDLAAFGVVTISVVAWSWYGSLTACAFIAGTTVAKARLLATSRMPGEVAKGIGSAGEGTSTDLYELSDGGRLTQPTDRL